MTTPSREPSRLPVRGTIAAVGTVGALALLLSFRGGPLAPSDPALAVTESTSADEAEAADELLDVVANETAAPEPILDEPGTDGTTATGDAVAIRWGDVQVAVTVRGHDIIEVETLAIPMGDRHSQRISTYVEPILREEAIAYDTADVSVISGATYTSEAYAASLQSALDQLDA